MPFMTTTDDNALYYTDWGTGQPIVLIHGWPLSSAFWEHQATFLAEAGYRVIAYDRRGFGRSEQPWDGYDYKRLTQDLAELIDHLDLNEVTLVGFSMGGGEVARYLSHHGTSRIVRAVLIAAVTPYLLQSADNPDGVPAAVFDDMDAQLRLDRPRYLESFARDFFGVDASDSTISDATLRWYMHLALQASPRATTATARAWSHTDFRDDMAAFTIPTLIIHGQADTNVPPAATGRAAATAITHARYVEVPNAHHAVIIDNAATVNNELMNFLSST